MDKIEEAAKRFEDDVRKAFVKIYGKPPREEYASDVRSSYLEPGRAQGWHKPPNPEVVLVGTESGWINDPYSHAADHEMWAKVIGILRKTGWPRAWWDSINPAVHIVYLEE